MRSGRPINLDLSTIRFPLTAITSIIHRMTGVVLFLGLPLLLWLGDRSLASAAGFAQAQELWQHPLGKVGLWLYSAALIYHLVAGVRHLCMDIGFFETKHSAKQASVGVLALSAVLIVFMGVWLW